MRPTQTNTTARNTGTWMIKVIVAGTAGRMGSRLVALMKESAALTLGAAVEKKGHAAVGGDAGELAGCGPSLVLI
ncbi:MAG: hypothetical protein ACKO9T_11010, partial [Nitrospira sp.]